MSAKQKRVAWLRGVVLAGGAAVFGGCAGMEPEPRNAARRMPAMPTIAPGPAMSEGAVVASEPERLARAERLVLANDFGGAVSALTSGGDAVQWARWARQVAEKVAASDPAKAASFALAYPPLAAQRPAVEVAARAWAKRDGDAAMRWALGISEITAGATARRFVAEELVAAGGRSAVERMMGFPAEARRDEMMGFAAAAWARREPDAAVDWVRGQPEGELRTRLISSVGFQLAQTHPQRAIELSELLPAGRDRWLLTSALAQTWVVKDPKAAFAWAQQMPEGEARQAAYAGFDTGLGIPAKRRVASAPGTRSGSSRTRGGAAAAAAWREGDSPSFELWLASQRPGMTRDEAVRLHVDALLNAAPRDAVAYLRTLPRSEQSPEMLERAARRLMATDPGAAERMINESTLPEFRKEELRRELRR